MWCGGGEREEESSSYAATEEAFPSTLTTLQSCRCLRRKYVSLNGFHLHRHSFGSSSGTFPSGWVTEESFFHLFPPQSPHCRGLNFYKKRFLETWRLLSASLRKERSAVGGWEGEHETERGCSRKNSISTLLRELSFCGGKWKSGTQRNRFSCFVKKVFRDEIREGSFRRLMIERQRRRSINYTLLTEGCFWMLSTPSPTIHYFLPYPQSPASTFTFRIRNKVIMVLIPSSSTFTDRERKRGRDATWNRLRDCFIPLTRSKALHLISWLLIRLSSLLFMAELGRRVN